MNDFILECGKKGYSVDIVVSDTQQKLTQKFVIPIIDKLIDTIKKYREEFDKNYLNNITFSNNKVAYGIIDSKEYPKGHCRIIRDGLFEKLKNNPIIEELIKKGVIFKEVFVILNNSYTQNGIQLGSLFIDVANDTVNKQEKIYYKNIKELNYKNLENYNSYYKMLEKYLKLSIYPNIYMPKVANIFPAVAIDSENRCHLLLHQEIILYKDISKNFALSKKFLKKNKFKNKILPPNFVILLKLLEQNVKVDMSLLLDRYFKAKDEFEKGLISEMFENEFFEIKNNLPIGLMILQSRNKK